MSPLCLEQLLPWDWMQVTSRANQQARETPKMESLGFKEKQSLNARGRIAESRVMVRKALLIFPPPRYKPASFRIFFLNLGLTVFLFLFYFPNPLPLLFNFLFHLPLFPCRVMSQNVLLYLWIKFEIHCFSFCQGASRMCCLFSL